LRILHSLFSTLYLNMVSSAETHLVTHSPAETRALGECLGRAVRAGDVIALIGGLGVGKTVLTKGIVAGLGGDPDKVTSPTFVLMIRHEARLPLCHFDAYRLGGSEALLEIGAEEVLYGEGVCVVEWAERGADALPPDRLEIGMEVAGETDRKVRMLGKGPRSQSLAAEIASRSLC